MNLKNKFIAINLVIANLILPMNYILNTKSFAINLSNNLIVNSKMDESEVIDKWEVRTPMPTPRAYLTSAVVDGKIYCIGGRNASAVLNKVEVYDPATDKWETKASMPTARDNLISVVLDDKIYCIGGSSGETRYNKVEVYDPKTDTWEVKAHTLNSRQSLSGVVLDGKIYIMGGFNNLATFSSVEVYDPATDRWEFKTPMLTARYALTSEVVNGKIYAIGGYNGSRLNTVEVYDPATDKWEKKASMPTGRSGLTSDVVDNKIYCIGGNNNSRLNTVEVYDSVSDTWVEKSSILVSRDSLTSSVVNGIIYAIGGTNGNYLDNVECYIMNSNSPQYKAEQAVLNAEIAKDYTVLGYARDLVNQLPESDLKNELQDRLNTIALNLNLESKKVTSNLDLYIKSENMLSMTLSTNSITFEDYSGVDDLEILNAIDISINSSLPYQINSYLLSEIKNSDATKYIDKSLFKIRCNDEVSYNVFNDINEKLVLKDNCDAGNDKSHSIDLMLEGGDAYEADTYKTIIKFEAEQK